MDVAKYIARLRAEATEHAVGGLKRGPTASSDATYTLGWLCGFQQGLAYAEEVLNKILSEEQEKEGES